MVRPLRLPVGFVPSLIIGHGRISGSFAKSQTSDHFKKAKRIHFVHMAPDEIEWFKSTENPAAIADERERIELELAGDADLVVAVGPRLFREFSDSLQGIRSTVSIHEFVPGPSAPADSHSPQGNHCLVLGRDDYELKGLDIAARALGRVIRDKRFTGPTPELVVRGATLGSGSDLRTRLQRECIGIDLPVRVRHYNSAEETIEADLRRSALLLMPSRSEGFGLVALEALSVGTPVLVSDKSGFGEIVRKYAPAALAQNVVVETPQDVDAAAIKWADAIAVQLMDKPASFARSAKLCEVLVGEIGWDRATRELIAKIDGF